MKRSELLARVTVLLGLTLVLLPLTNRFTRDALELHATMAENGGWAPDALHAQVGVPLELRLTSDDVTHGFAVGRMQMQAVDVLPGEVTELTLTFDQPGIYTFYCTRWCGVNHWRMRGTIEVGGASDAPEAGSAPLYLTLGLDLDAPHPAAALPADKPSALRGRQVVDAHPSLQGISIAYYRSHSPAATYEDLRGDPALQSLTDAQIWDAVAYLWSAQTTPEELAEGQNLYVQNCAACHGRNGAGDGVFADDLAAAGESSARAMNGMQAMSMQTPAAFTDAESLLGASPALLQGKILRGGMGTGMPMWGTIFTDEQLWHIAAYLYTFQFEEVQE